MVVYAINKLDASCNCYTFSCILTMNTFKHYRESRLGGLSLEDLKRIGG